MFTNEAALLAMIDGVYGCSADACPCGAVPSRSTPEMRGLDGEM